MPHVRSIRVAVVALILLLASVAFADSSLKLGAVFPGWDRVRSGGLYDAAVDMARDYGRQVGHFCSLPEVFFRDRATSILTAELFYESYLPFGSSEVMLLESRDQRVAMIRRSTSPSDVLSVMVALRSGVVLVLC